jgi:hypothetical protein
MQIGGYERASSWFAEHPLIKNPCHPHGAADPNIYARWRTAVNVRTCRFR